jgi:ADP-ribose pyrophosphatase
MTPERRDIFQGRILSLGVETHLLPDGRKAEFEIVRHPGGAAVLPVLNDGRVLLLRQFRPAAGDAVLEIPAGRLEPGEAPAACARRELAEVAGYRAGRLERLGETLSSVGFCDERIYLFLARDLVSVPAAPEPDEFLEPLVLSLDEALARVRAGQINDAKTQLALLLWRDLILTRE